MTTVDHSLFLDLNFDGGVCMDRLMLLCSGKLTWVPLYALILWLVYRRTGLRNLLLFAGLAVLSVVLTDIVAGIFKHSGLLKNLLPDFQPRLRPMYTPELEGLVHVVKRGGQFGTVSAHDLLHRPAGFADPAPGVVLPRNGCLGGAGLLFAHLSRLPLSPRHPLRTAARHPLGPALGVGVPPAETIEKRIDLTADPFCSEISLISSRK